LKHDYRLQKLKRKTFFYFKTIFSTYK